MLFSRKMKPYGERYSDMFVPSFSFFLACDCDNVQRVDEDQFLGRKEMICEKCEWIGVSDMKWMRKRVTLEDVRKH